MDESKPLKEKMKTFLKMLLAILAFIAIPAIVTIEVSGAITVPVPYTQRAANEVFFGKLVKDPAALRNYALSECVDGHEFIWSEGMDWDNSAKTSAQVTGNGAENIMNNLLNVQLFYSYTNGFDVFEDFYLRNIRDIGLVYGYGYVASTNTYADFTPALYVNDVPMLDQVLNAHVVVFDPEGNVVPDFGFDLYVRYGQIRFPSWLAQYSGGRIEGTYNDGATFILPLAGAQTNFVKAKDEPFKVNGHYVVRKGDRVLRINEAWEVPTVYVEADAVVRLDISTSYYDQVTGKYVNDQPANMEATGTMGRNKGKTRTVKLRWVRGAWPLVKLNEGERVKFNFTYFGQARPIFSGGKGTIGVSKVAGTEPSHYEVQKAKYIANPPPPEK